MTNKDPRAKWYSLFDAIALLLVGVLFVLLLYLGCMLMPEGCYTN